MKEATISLLINRASLPRVQAEVAKCQVVCSNCHRKYHHRLREFGAPPFALRVRGKELREPPANRVEGFDEAMAELRRKIFPDLEQVEDSVSPVPLETGPSKLSDDLSCDPWIESDDDDEELLETAALEQRRRALIAALVRTDEELSARRGRSGKQRS